MKKVKESYEPLFAPGFHGVPFENLKERLTELLVVPFSNKTRRQLLLQRLLELLEEMETFGDAGIFVEMWIDGSFVTKKEVPNDVDIVIVYATGTDVNQKLKDHDMLAKRYCCDVLLVESADTFTQELYQEVFGKGHDGSQKGMIRVRF